VKAADSVKGFVGGVMGPADTPDPMEGSRPAFSVIDGPKAPTGTSERSHDISHTFVAEIKGTSVASGSVAGLQSKMAPVSVPASAPVSVIEPPKSVLDTGMKDVAGTLQRQLGMI
jgi:hypothetical protein